MPRHTGSLKLYPVGTVNMVAIGSVNGLANADSRLVRHRRGNRQVAEFNLRARRG